MIRRLTIQIALAVAFGGSAMAAEAAYLAKSKEIRGGEAPVEMTGSVCLAWLGLAWLWSK